MLKLDKTPKSTVCRQKTHVPNIADFCFPKLGFCHDTKYHHYNTIMKRSSKKMHFTEEEERERKEKRRKQSRVSKAKKRAEARAQSTQGFLKEKLEKEAKKSWPYTLVPDFEQIFRQDPKCNNLYHELLQNGFCILSIDATIFELLQMNIKSIKRIHNAEERPTHIYSELELPGAIFDAPGSV